MTMLVATGVMRCIDDSSFAKMSQAECVENGVCSILLNKCHANRKISGDDQNSQYRTLNKCFAISLPKE